MYHCHFEDVEHVQMGMTGIVFVTPTTDTATVKSAYADGDGSTRYDRQYALLLNEIDPRPHDNLEAVQEFQWTDYEPVYWIINGRAYPDTVKPENDPSTATPADLVADPGQPRPARAAADRQPRLRAARDAAHRHPDDRRRRGRHAAARGRPAPTSPTATNTIYIGPGESRDVIFVAPPFVPGARQAPRRRAGPGTRTCSRTAATSGSTTTAATDAATGLGGMVTEVRVYQNPLPAQTRPNQTH